jgi:hypothetical protein
MAYLKIKKRLPMRRNMMNVKQPDGRVDSDGLDLNVVLFG